MIRSLHVGLAPGFSMLNYPRTDFQKRSGFSRSAYFLSSSKSFKKWRQPRFVVAPSPDRIRKQWTTYLKLAQCPHRAFVFIEAQAALVPFKATEGNDSSAFVFEIRHQRFILHFQHTIRRQHCAPMCHQFLIGTVVSPQFTEVVGKVEPAAEQFRITGKAGVARIPLDMNNAGFR